MLNEHKKESVLILTSSDLDDLSDESLTQCGDEKETETELHRMFKLEGKLELIQKMRGMLGGTVIERHQRKY